MIMISVFVVAVLVFTTCFLLYTVKSKEDYLNNVNIRIKSLKEVEDMLDTRNSLGEEVGKYEKSIESIVSSQMDYNAVLQSISLYFPKSVVADSVDIDSTTKVIQITGHTDTVQHLAWVVNSLSQNKDFQSVIVTNYTIPYQKTDNKEVTDITFTLSVTLR